MYEYQSPVLRNKNVTRQALLPTNTIIQRDRLVDTKSKNNYPVYTGDNFEKNHIGAQTQYFARGPKSVFAVNDLKSEIEKNHVSPYTHLFRGKDSSDIYVECAGTNVRLCGYAENKQEILPREGGGFRFELELEHLEDI